MVGGYKHKLTGLFGPDILPKTSITPENGWLEYDRFLSVRPIFRCKLLVSGRVNHPSVFRFSVSLTLSAMGKYTGP